MNITLDAGVDAPAAARHEMARQRSRLGGRFDDALIVVTELVTNSVLHGPPGGSIDVVTSVTGRYMHIEVTDGGTGFQGMTPDGRDLFQGMTPDGRGLRIVSAIATRWGVVRGPCRVWADLDLTAPTARGEDAGST